MCGIIGTINLKLNRKACEEILSQRGPDQISHYQTENINILFGRLAIVGKSKLETSQPFVTKDYVLFCNGFISNYIELYSYLKIEDKFSDCAVLLNLYEKFGISGFEKVNGQFAAVIIDRVKKELILIRDSSGICPLYYRKLGDSSLIFASQANWIEEKQIEDKIDLNNQLNESSVEEYFSVGYVLPPKTLIRDIFQVTPGFICKFELNDTLRKSNFKFGTVRIQEKLKSISRSELSLIIKETLIQAVSRNIRGDFQPWLLFSGGLDSSILLHILSDLRVKVNLISLVYPDRSNSQELELATYLANYYGQKIQIIEYNEISSLLNRNSVFKHRIDWPFDGGSLFAKLFIANHIKLNEGKIALGGTGADELFGGYSRHRNRLKILNEKRRVNEFEKYYFLNFISKKSEIESLFNRYKNLVNNSKFVDPSLIYDLLEISQQHCPRVDSCFANVGIEYRPIFLDKNLISISASLPLEVKSEIGRPKSILRETFYRDMPSKIINAPKKPLRFGEMKPNNKWRRKLFNSWLNARMISEDS